MRPSCGTGTVNRVVGASIPPLFLVGMAFAGWITIWMPYAWAARDVRWFVSYGTATLFALALPLTCLTLYERWQLRHGVYREVPSRGTRSLSWGCGIFATFLGLLSLPLALLSAFFVWVTWSDGATVASLYFAVVALGMLAQPAGFLAHYDRWHERNHLR